MVFFQSNNRVKFHHTFQNYVTTPRANCIRYFTLIVSRTGSAGKPVGSYAKGQGSISALNSVEIDLLLRTAYLFIFLIIIIQFKLQYGQIPQQPPPYKPLPFKPIQPQQAAYKGIQAARPNPRVPVQPPQNNYTPQYKTQYGQQQGPNALYRPAITGPPPGAKYPSHPQPYLSQYPKNLPPHLQKIIDAQRSYQGEFS